MGADEVVQGQGYLFGRLEAAAQGHRPRQVQHHHRGRLGDLLRGVDLEVVLVQPHRHLRPLAEDGVHHGLAQIEVEGVAELVLLRLIDAFAAGTALAQGVLAVVGLLELGVDLSQSLLADLADATRRQLPVAALAPDVARLLQYLQELL